MSDLPPAFLCGLIGAGLQGSLSPALHEAEGGALGLRNLYQRIDLDALGLSVEALPELLLAAERTGFTGVNITHPCKQAVIPLLDELAPSAQSAGAVNTVLFRGGRRIGHNTDLTGFAEGFRRALPEVRRAHVVQLGAGGAGSAVAHAALELLGIKQLTVFDIDAVRAGQLVARLGPAARVGSDLATAMAAADGLIHCTPTGMDKYPGLPLDAALLHPGLWVAEIVYFPLETALLREAKARGCRTADGSGMAVFQAVGAFRLFTGMEPDAERMLGHFRALTQRAAAQA